MRRREFLRYAAALPAIARVGLSDAHASQPFSYDTLQSHARSLAASAYRPSTDALPPVLRELTYDQYQSLRFKRDRAIWAADSLQFRVELFHLGFNFNTPVRMYEVVAGQAHAIRYRADMFETNASGLPAAALRADIGFAGFRIRSAPHWDGETAAFLGASYFRSRAADGDQFGASARGLAIDTANGIEEFPDFVAWWFERPAPGSRTLTIYGLLDSPSAAGAYRFAITPNACTTMEVSAALYARKPIRRLGIAPLTSMFLCGENDRRAAYDWRTEIHDSDGLAIWTGSGERIWRPLTNPSCIRVNSYLDENPRGFGLLQRDRDFSSYQDDGVFYERRPSIWIEPQGAWGKGAVQLVELTAPDETFDNIVAYWNPERAVRPGNELLYGYRIYWGTPAAAAPPVGYTLATRTGLGGVVGRKRDYFSARFAVDFIGGALADLRAGAAVEPVLSVSDGTVEHASARPLADGPFKGRGFRAIFDVKPRDDSSEPIDIRMYLRSPDQPLTETWMYQWLVPPPAVRKEMLALAGSGTS